MDEDRKTAETERTGKVRGVAYGAVGAGAAAFARAGFSDPRLVMHWADIVGRQAAALCQPLKLSGGALTLVADPGAVVFLSYETRGMIARIEAYLGAGTIKRIKIVPGDPIVAPPPRPRQAAAATVPTGDPALDFAGPEMLRDALLRLARARAGGPVGG